MLLWPFGFMALQTVEVCLSVCQCLWAPQLGQSEVNIISHILHGGTGTPKVYVFTELYKEGPPSWPRGGGAPGPAPPYSSPSVSVQQPPCKSIGRGRKPDPRVVLKNVRRIKGSSLRPPGTSHPRYI